LAQSGHPSLHRTCPLLGVKRTWRLHYEMSAYDPKRTISLATNNRETSPTASVEEMLLAPFLKSKMASLAVRYYRRWIFAQQKLERFFSGPISFPDRLKIILRIFDWTGSTGPVNLAPPWLRRFCPVFHDNGKVLIPQHKNHNTAEMSASVEKLRRYFRLGIGNGYALRDRDPYAAGNRPDTGRGLCLSPGLELVARRPHVQYGNVVDGKHC
jgi:hypothetical protein